MFQFHIGAIRSHYTQRPLPRFLGFNSILVQLEDTTAQLYSPPWPGFNSILVQLEVLWRVWALSLSLKCFNSILVQLEASSGKLLGVTYMRFNSILVQLEERHKTRTTP